MNTENALSATHTDDRLSNGREGSSLLADMCLLVMEQIRILPRRLLLDTPGVQATVPMLRGVWGAALHDLDLAVYQSVFEGKGDSDSRPPGYLLRPAPADPEYAPAIEWFLLGDAVGHDPLLCQAWNAACDRGLGPDRARFRIADAKVLGPSHAASHSGGPWSLAQGAHRFKDLATRPCRLTFPAPLRLRRHGRLIEQPVLADIVVAATRRIGVFVPGDHQAYWRLLSRRLLDLSRIVPADTWQGERLDLVRYSGRQLRELDLHGVAGHLDLPAGTDDLWPLLAAATWLHIGKGTVMGLGQMVVETSTQHDEVW